MKAERIIRQLKENKSISEIAKDEKINRYSVALVKQTLELLEKEHQTKQKYDDEITKLRDENKKLKDELNELTEQNKKLKTKINENKSFLKCVSKYPYEFFIVLIVYAIIFAIALVVVKKFF